MGKRGKTYRDDPGTIRRTLLREDAWGPIYLGEPVGSPIAHACGLCGAVVSALPAYREQHIKFHENLAEVEKDLRAQTRPVIRNV